MYTVENIIKMLQSNLNISKYAAVEAFSSLPRNKHTYDTLSQLEFNINSYLQKELDEFLNNLRLELATVNSD